MSINDLNQTHRLSEKLFDVITIGVKLLVLGCMRSLQNL